MMLDSNFRPQFQKIFIDPLLPIFATSHPHFITAMGLTTGLSIIPLLYYQYSLWALVMLGISGYFDILDGSIARFRDMSKPVGAVFDIVSDRMVEFSILLGLYFYDPLRALPILIMLGSVLVCVTSFLVVGIFTENQSTKSFYYSPGLIERAEAFTFWGLMILNPYYFYPLAYLFAGLVYLTAMIRIKQFYQRQ